MIRPLIFALMLMVAAMPAALAKGVEVGKDIPAIAAKDQNGKEQSFDSLKGSKGLTIVFIRSVEWCPFCQRQVMDLSENAKKFSDAGYPVVTISYDAVDKLKQFATKFKTDLPLLSDPRSDIIKAFGIFNDNYAKGTMAFGTPFPGVYVVGADKKVKAKFFKEGVQDRPSVDELLASMKEPEPAPVDPAVEFPQEPVSATEPVMPEAQEPVAPAAPDVTSIENAPVEAPPAPTEAVVPEAPAAADVAEPVEEAPVAPEASATEPEPMEFVPPADELPVEEEAPSSSGL